MAVVDTTNAAATATEFATLGTWTYLASSLTLLALSLCLGIFVPWLIVDRLRAWSKRPNLAKYAWLVASAGFGAGWLATIIDRPGVTALPYYSFFKPVLYVLVPAVAASGVWGFFFSEWLSRNQRRLFASVLIVGGVAVNLAVAPLFMQFHGFLAFACAVLLVWLLVTSTEEKPLTYVGLVVLAAALVFGVVQGPGLTKHTADMNIRSRVTLPMLVANPLTRPLRMPPRSVIGAEVPDEAPAVETIEREVQSRARETGKSAHGRNVVLIILDTLRTDAWDSPEVATRFHASIKQRGVYAPRATATFGSTVGAYGAMFESQSAAVLFYSPYWGDRRLFDGVSDRFEHHLLFRDEDPWFDRTAPIHEFISPDAPLNRCSGAERCFDGLRASIEELPGDESFFGWVHVVEPHSPYKKWPDHDFGDSMEARYHSEVAYVDHQLGGFLEWFYRQPQARDTLVLVVSDHGEALGEVIFGRPAHYHASHIDDVVMQVPFFASGPGLPKGRTDATLPVSLLDVIPTIYDFVGVQMPSETLPQGRSLYDLLDSPGPRVRVAEAYPHPNYRALFEFAARQPTQNLDRWRSRLILDSPKPLLTGLYYGDHKLVYDRLRRRYWLFETADNGDPRVDVSGEKPEVFEQMKRRLREWRGRQTAIAHELERRRMAED
jgi:hypothetical protein